ncbi:MAG TPA: NusG domain II-containing protein [Candidatus Scatomorpha intestinavium]|uniref:NusG domain II-containing protein n=1 Tax=Candidatus Scatomorpha intestinavium TaxID=2840922 RepID=A0A9D0ZD20_9FIRM|nr:NusG domain II-containing protein [Candidatus Scatomorpha intestinavium]
MEKNLRLKFRPGDLIAAAAIAILAGAVAIAFFTTRSSGPAEAEIRQNGELIATVPLSEDTEFEIGGTYHNTVTVKDGEIAITSSDCPGEDCVLSGWRSTAGQSIVCLPNLVEIRIVAAEGSNDQGVDGVTG